MAQSPQHRLAIHFQRYGPYHKARLASASQQLAAIGWDAIGLETASVDAVYQWQSESHPQQSGIHTVFPGKAVESLSRQQIHQGIDQALCQFNPAAVAIAGWASADALACLAWCRTHCRPALLMSETRAADGKRFWIKEAIKSWRIKPFHGALVGGASHVAYLRSLDFSGPVVTGYNVVDNAYFLAETTKWRGHDSPLRLISRPYILASNRFVERKNLLRLVQAFAAVAHSVGTGHAAAADLCLVGDGPQRAALQATCEALGLAVVAAAPWEVSGNDPAAPTRPRVFLPGFRQIEELPRFYAHACCFVHPAISEPWGLVINEAMACGLPVLCSSNCGAAEELVREGVNGFLFDPLDASAITLCLQNFLDCSSEAKAEMGAASSLRLERFCPMAAFGNGLRELLSELSAA
jgi:glycosyltransferase involved in cell wall biosynthesis